MSAPADCLIPLEQEQSLLGRLLARDPTVQPDVATVYLAHLIDWLTAKNSARVPVDFCIEAAEDALVALFKSPESFNPARGLRLAPYLRMSAQGDLRNRLQKERRQDREHVRLADVELSADAGKYLTVDDDPLLLLERKEESATDLKEAEEILRRVREGLSEAEMRVLDLMLDGEWRTPVFAVPLGIGHLPAEVQRAEVKRVKDKLKKRLEREKEGHVEPS